MQKHITINQLTNIEANFHLEVNARECAKRMKVGKDKIYTYYKFFKEGKSLEEIFKQYKINKSKCGRKKIVLSEDKLIYINHKLDDDWSLDAIAGRDKLLDAEERCGTNTLYRMVSDGIITANKLRRKGKRKANGQKETRGKINICNTIHQRNFKHPLSLKGAEYGHFEGDTIVGEKRKSAIVTLVEKKTKYIVLIKASRKSEDVETGVNHWLDSNDKDIVKTITFDRGKEFSRWKEIENRNAGLEIYFGDPGSPGQRGLNENSNGIVRKDLPKKTDLSKHSQSDLNKIADKWNSIPRKALNYFTPKEMLEIEISETNILPSPSLSTCLI